MKHALLYGGRAVGSMHGGWLLWWLLLLRNLQPTIRGGRPLHFSVYISQLDLKGTSKNRLSQAGPTGIGDARMKYLPIAGLFDRFCRSFSAVSGQFLFFQAATGALTPRRLKYA
jgi:hypothetical protein